jgi:ribonuclease III
MAPAAAELAERLGLRFADLGLLQQALIHSSYTNEQPSAGASNERLEFLGDAVVSLVISESLFEHYPGEDEGALTTRRAAIVSSASLASIARRLDLGEFLLLGAGATQAGERARDSILAGAFEAVAGAMYVEHGLELTRRWLLDVCAPELQARPEVQTLKAPKSRLQELAYAETSRPPHYRVVSAEGPHHARLYEVEVSVGGRVLGQGRGRNRREAETEAASEALGRLADEGAEAGR